MHPFPDRCDRDIGYAIIKHEKNGFMFIYLSPAGVAFMIDHMRKIGSGIDWTLMS